MHIRLEFKPQDCWVGVFWRSLPVWWRRGQWHGIQETGNPPGTVVNVWICLVPMLPIHITFVRAARGVTERSGR